MQSTPDPEPEPGVIPGPPLLPPSEGTSQSLPQTQSSLRKGDLLRELRQFICDHQGFYLLLTPFFFPKLKKKKKLLSPALTLASPFPATPCNNSTGSPSWYLAPELSSTKQARRKTSVTNHSVFPSHLPPAPFTLSFLKLRTLHLSSAHYAWAVCCGRNICYMLLH